MAEKSQADKIRSFVGAKAHKIKNEGKPAAQAFAIAISKAIKKFGEAAVNAVFPPKGTRAKK